MKNTIELAREIKKGLSEVISVERLFLIGNFRKETFLNTELDFVVVITNGVNKFDFVTKTSEMAIGYIQKYHFMFLFFPVYNSDFSAKPNAFIKNVQKNGVEI